MLERLEAFRELIRHGNALLGEVVAYCRAAETAVTQIAAEKQDIDRSRGELEAARQRAESEASSAQKALQQVDAQRRELADIRTELMSARAEVSQFQQAHTDTAATLAQSLQDAKEQHLRLECELQRVQLESASARSIDVRLEHVDQIQTKLRAAEAELADTRRALEAERGRRDRAIALIKPRPVVEGARA